MNDAEKTISIDAPKWRPEVIRFADLMESRLRENDHKGGWSKCAPHWLLRRMIGETFELLNEINPEPPYDIQFYAASQMLSSACREFEYIPDSIKFDYTPGKLCHEAVDVANFAMMFIDRCVGLTDP